MNDLLRLAFGNITHAKKRSWLTMIGILIGIAAVVSLISLSEGLKGSIDEQFQKIGSDKLFIQSSANLFGVGGDLANPLNDRDERAVRSVPGVQEVAGWLTRSARVEVGDDVIFPLVAGVPTDDGYVLARQASTVDLAEGRELRAGDGNVVLAGAQYARPDVFLEPLSLGDRVIVNDQRFTVVGILEPVGNPIDDRVLWMPLDRAEDLLGVKDERDMIIAQVSAGYDPVIVADDVERELRATRGQREGEEDFSIQTPEDLLASFGTILLIVNVVLIGIAGISLLVGGIGIMNTMYTSVLERTREIGIMKAIGATPRQIRLIFLFESGLLGLAGGAVGVAIGLLIAKGVEWIGGAALGSDFLTAYVSVWLVLGALAFAAGVGMLSGYLPAMQASRQNAVDSLRYE